MASCWKKCFCCASQTHPPAAAGQVEGAEVAPKELMASPSKKPLGSASQTHPPALGQEEGAEVTPKTTASSFKKLFGSARKKGPSASDPFRHCGFSRALYHVHRKHLGALHQAAYSGDLLLLEHVVWNMECGVNARDKKKRTALHLACSSGRSKVVTFLVQKQCELNIRDDKERTALMKAVQCQEVECAVFLLEQGADPNLQDVYGNTALHYAVYNENELLTEELLSHHADIEAKNKTDMTPLLLAVNKKSPAMVEFLLKKNANVNAVDKWKRTAFMLALRGKSLDIASLLLLHGGIDVSLKDVSGWTAEDLAAANDLKILHKQVIIEEAGSGSESSQNSSKHPSQKSNPEDDDKRSEDSSSSELGVDVPQSWHSSDDENPLGPEPKVNSIQNLKELYIAFLKGKNYISEEEENIKFPLEPENLSEHLPPTPVVPFVEDADQEGENTVNEEVEVSAAEYIERATEEAASLVPFQDTRRPEEGQEIRKRKGVKGNEE
ncbi:putative ankyrin repeat domain-containing protein 19 [Eulemur rufifrons]|uniref:putative ankyrin repeat domain-containing protein 19 n=1 Tax=Eulemur rufifrons TaxID=859984 RepID=UPI003743FD04